MQENHSVEIRPFAERHFISNFSKKYKSHWDITMAAIVAELERIDMLLLTDRAEILSDSREVKIIKTKFKVVKSNESAKASGNRCIVAWHSEKHSVSILLVYGKTDLSGHNETADWKRLVRENYPEYAHLCG
jgi:hypothetical protein